MTQFNLTTDLIVSNYRKLASQDSQQRQAANQFLMTLPDHEQTWGLAQNMIKASQDPNFIFLGAQLLYQKIQRDLHQFSNQFMSQLKDFIFAQLDQGKISQIFIIDKLASSAGLICSLLFLDVWPSFLEDLTEFMKKSNHHLKCGLIILERIPQQLRMTNRISQGNKTKIQNKFLDKVTLLAVIFDSVFGLDDQICIIRSLKAMQSWIRISFPLMKYPQILKKVLQHSLQNFQKLQLGIKVICQGLKISSQQKCMTISEIDPLKQQQIYSEEQIASIKLTIAFITENKTNFLNYAKIEVQYVQAYLSVVQQLCLSFSFLILQDIGFEILKIILEITSSNDLKLSFFTFQFWMDYSQKMSRIKLPENSKQRIWITFTDLFQLFCKKLLIQNESFMFEADLKQDQTVDQADGMTFSQYRKESAGLLKYIYDFFVKIKKEKGTQLYFKTVGELLQQDNQKLSRYTELAIYLLKSPLQSMINPFETSHIIQVLEFLITKVNGYGISKHGQIPPIVLGQTMNFIRDCTRQIKQKDHLFLESLKFVLNYINDQKLCHHAAYCFQILMQTINTLNDSLIAENLIQFYQQKTFNKQVVLQKMLQGIFNAIIKVPDQNKVQSYLNIILTTLIKKYQICSKQITYDLQNRSDLFLSLVQIKTVLDSFDGSSSNFKNLYKQKFIQLANKAVCIVNDILPLGIKNNLKFSSINEIGQSVSIYRVCLKILQKPQNFFEPYFVTTLNVPLLILSNKDINEYFYTITILSETLVQFINHDSSPLNQWLVNNLQNFCQFFFHYYEQIQKVDPDVIKMFFTVQQSLILYNRNIFNQYPQKLSILKMALFSLRHLNQRNMQRKIISFINLSLQNQIYDKNSSYKDIAQSIFASIPLIHSMCYSNLAKIFKQLFHGVSSEEKDNLFISLLGLNPYQDVLSSGSGEPMLRGMIGKAMSLALQTEQDRNIKTIFQQIHQIVWKKVSNDILMQLQLKMAAWKRQLKKKQQQQLQNKK